MAPTMPSKNHSSAPKFDGKAGSLPMFLDDVEQLANNCELTPKQTIEWAIRYAPGSDEHELWSSLDSASGADWDAFKTELYKQYPGATGDRKYSVANLEMLTEKQAAGQITTSDQFGTYYRAFSKISRFLKAKNKLNDREISSLFMRGLDYAFRLQVRAQLRAENPKHHSDDPYTLAQICDAALFILSCNHDDSEDTAPATEASATVKREQYDLTSLTSPGAAGVNINALALELLKHLNIQQTPSNVFQAASANTGYNPNFQRPRSNDCSFCSDPTHYQYSCAKLAEYIQKGLCMRNNENMIVLPNGNRVTPRLAPGKNMQERIDNWHRANPSSQATVSSNFVAGDMAWSLPLTTAYTESRIEEVPDEEAPVTRREAEEVQMLEALITSTQKKVDDAKRKMGAAKTYAGPTTRNMSKSDSHASVKPAEQTSGQAPPPQSNVPAPQFRYTTPIEDPKVAEKVLKRALEAPVTLTGRELLAVAPDVRKQFRELVSTRKVSTGHVGLLGLEDGEKVLGLETYMASLLPSGDRVVAKHSVGLRALDFKIGELTVEGVMDEGSQICVLRRDIWERLGLPLRSDHIMIMESANASKNSTLGLLQDLEISVGGYSFYIQVQVVQEAPYELLVGRPFMTLTKLTTKHHEDGSSDVILIDPNSGAVITVPTRERKRDQERCTHGHHGAHSASVGF